MSWSSYQNVSTSDEAELGNANENSTGVQNATTEHDEVTLPYEFHTSTFSIMTRKEKVFVGICVVAMFTSVIALQKRYLLRVDQQGIMRRVVTTQFIPWEDVRCIRIKQELDPDADYICPDGECIRPRVRTIIMFIGSRHIIETKQHAKKLEPLARLLCSMKPDLVNVATVPTMRRRGLWW